MVECLRAKLTFLLNNAQLVLQLDADWPTHAAMLPEADESRAEINRAEPEEDQAEASKNTLLQWAANVLLRAPT